MTTRANARDRALLLRVQAGRRDPPHDSDAESEYFARFRQTHAAWVTRSVRNQADAEDLLQEAMLRIFLNIASYNPAAESSAGAWARTLLRNVVLTGLAKLRRREASLDASVDVDTGVSSGTALADPRSIGRGAIGAFSLRVAHPRSLDEDEPDDTTALRAAGVMPRLSRLKSPYVRAALMFAAGMSDDVVADDLGIGLNSVRMYRKRGMKILEHELADYRGQRKKPRDGRTRRSDTQEDEK